MWAVIMLIVAAVVASLVSLTRGDVAYVLVIVWAFVGIAVKHSDTALIAILAAFLAGFVLGTLLLGVFLGDRRVHDQPLSTEQRGARDRW
jgi:uncharacterized membrane protein YciS (DUF1049 family)